MVIIRNFGIAETTSFFRITSPSFYRLFRQFRFKPVQDLAVGVSSPVVPNCPFLLSVSPVASASLPSEPPFCSAKVVGLRKCQVTAISLCFIKNNDAGCACPTFLMSKTCRVTYNPNLIEAEKKAQNSDGE